MSRWACIAAILAVSVGGCVDSTSPPPPDDPLPPPEPGAFKEGAPLKVLEDFLLNGTFLPSCETLEAHEQEIAQSLATEHHRVAVREAVDACSDITTQEGRDAAVAAAEAENEKTAFQAAVSRASYAIARTYALLDNQTVGNAAEAQGLGVLMGYHLYHRAQLEVARMAFENYLEGGLHYDLNHAFINVWSIPLEEGTIERFLKLYPWDESQVCQAAPHAARTVAALLNATVENASRQAPPDDANWVTEMYGALLKAIKPDTEFYLEHGWDAALLASWTRLDLDAQYWEQYADEPPSREEAERLYHAFRAQVRTITTEYEAGGLYPPIELETPWREEHARFAAALSGMKWHFQEPDFVCEPSDAN